MAENTAHLAANNGFSWGGVSGEKRRKKRGTVVPLFLLSLNQRPAASLNFLTIF